MGVRGGRGWLRRGAVVVAAMLGVGLAGPAGVVPAAAQTGESTLGAVTGFQAEGATYTFSAGQAKVRVVFVRDDMFRIWLAPDGKFTDPANTPPSDPNEPRANIVVRNDFGKVDTRWRDAGDHYTLATSAVTLRAYKSKLRFELYRADGTPVWRERAGLSWSEAGTTQRLSRGATEQYFGGGMQNGRFSHRDKTIQIAVDYNWADGGNPNASPFYWSTGGYGVFRNTFAPGSYAFAEPVATTHAEQRFDAYYVVGPPKQVLEGYTAVTGRPFMPPIYGLEMGDADCYNRSSPTYTGPKDPNKWTTPDAAKVAQGYVDNDMPRGWMLVNDGYGCEYQQLAETGKALRDRKIDMGLWTERSLTNQEFEVKTAGVRVRKLDVAWVGPGYRHALSGCEDAHKGIEQHSDARGFVWMVEGWAGAQRCAVQWTGDHSGTLDSIRWQIPAIHGSGNSGIAYTAGDIDGIFDGTDASYVRDLQWKVFTPALMSMSGWAPKDKQPWVRGEPYTSINRKYLKLRERLLPYLYTLAAQAHRTGVPLARSMVLEYPDDPRTWDETTTHQFLLGRDFLVAPVFNDATERDGIYIPAGRWVDYWSGTVHEGPLLLNDYAAPLDRLPLFVRAGAVVPMWKEGINNHRDQSPTDAITLDVYPRGDSTFELYEDDRVTRQHQNGQHAEQRFAVRAPQQGRGNVVIDIGTLSGQYNGKPGGRPYRLNAHTGTAPSAVLADNRPLPRLSAKDAFTAAAEGWYFDPADRAGTVLVKTAAMNTGTAHQVQLLGTTAIGGDQPDTSVTTVDAPTDLGPGSTVEVTTGFVNRTGVPVHDVRLSLAAPAGVGATPVSAAEFGLVLPGQRVDARYRVTVSGTAPDRYDLRGTTTFSHAGQRRTLTGTAPVRTTPPGVAVTIDDAAFAPGASREVTVTVTNHATRPVIDQIETTLATPPGWSATPIGPTAGTNLALGASVTSRWRVTAPTTNPPSSGALTAKLAYRAGSVSATSAGATPVLTIPDPAKVKLALDGGTDTTAVRPGWQRLAPGDAWAAGRTYGWVGTAPDSRDRGGPDDLRGDSVVHRENRTLRLTLPPGQHAVHLLVGDRYFPTYGTVLREGTREVLRSPDTTPTANWTWSAGTLDGGPTGRTVDVTLSGVNGEFWRVCALVVT